MLHLLTDRIGDVVGTMSDSENSGLVLKSKVRLPKGIAESKLIGLEDNRVISKKRERIVDDDDQMPSAELFSKMSRSERKRHREKKRRSDVNKGFDDLMALLVEIDPEVKSETDERARRGQLKGISVGQEDNLLSRVELISRTVEVLRRVHQENEERKRIITNLTGGQPDMRHLPTQSPLSNSNSRLLGSQLVSELAGQQASLTAPPFGDVISDALALRALADRNNLYTRALFESQRNSRMISEAASNPSTFRNFPLGALQSNLNSNMTLGGIQSLYNPSGVHSAPTDLSRYLQIMRDNEASLLARFRQQEGMSLSSLLNEDRGNKKDGNNRNP